MDDPNNELPGRFESVTPYLVPSSSDGDSLFTLPSTEPLALTRKYSRRWAVLPSMMANIPCSGVEPETLLSWLNMIFETHFTLSDGVKTCLLAFIDDGCDLGQVYGYLRPWMDNTPDDDAFSKILNQIAECRKRDFKLRSSAIDSNRIMDPKVPPRRVWDLYSNRVLPFYAVSSLPPTHESENIPEKLWAVSHSWLPPSARQCVLTTINSKAWHVPIPRDTTLDAIRNELLILGAEYVFLDVLCLRQKDELLPEFESIRKREWRLDVPTIGHVYSGSKQHVIVYFNGLGLPFHDGGANRKDQFHWFNRAWTLQECPSYLVPGGLKYKINGVKADYYIDTSWASQDFRDRFMSMAKWICIRDNQSVFGNYIEQIQSRYCSNPVDRVACLAYLLHCETLPIYDADMDVEVAWSLLLECLPGKTRTELLLTNFGPSGRSTSWRPTWEQVTACRTFRSPDISNTLHHLDGSSPDAGFRYGIDVYHSRSYVVEDCLFSISNSADQAAEAHVSVPCTCNAIPHRHRFRVSEWNDPIAPNVTYLLIRLAFDVCFNRSWWLLAQPQGIRLINNQRAIEVSKVSVIKIRVAPSDGMLGNGVNSRRTLVVYH